MSVSTFDELLSHEGHDIACVSYGRNIPDEGFGPVNAAIECNDCGCVLLDFDNPDDQEPT